MPKNQTQTGDLASVRSSRFVSPHGIITEEMLRFAKTDDLWHFANNLNAMLAYGCPKCGLTPNGCRNEGCRANQRKSTIPTGLASVAGWRLRRQHATSLSFTWLDLLKTLAAFTRQSPQQMAKYAQSHKSARTVQSAKP